MNDATPVRPSAIPGSGLLAGLAAGPATLDRIAWVKLSLILLPLKTPISDAKVLTGRQKPLTEVAMLFAEIESERGHHGHRLQLLEARRRATGSTRTPRRSPAT